MIYNVGTKEKGVKTEPMERNYVVAIIRDKNGEKAYHQFDNEEELRYFLAVHEECELVHAEMRGDE